MLYEVITNYMNDMILLVEDLTFTRIQLRNILIDGGYENICEAADAKTAITLAEEKRPVLAILDITLPDREDLSLIEDLRKIDPVITSYSIHYTKLYEWICRHIV